MGIKYSDWFCFNFCFDDLTFPLSVATMAMGVERLSPHTVQIMDIVLLRGKIKKRTNFNLVLMLKTFGREKCYLHQ